MDKLAMMTSKEVDAPKMEHLIETLCNQLRCSMLNADMERMSKARDLLTKFQHREIFDRILGPGAYIRDFEEDIERLKAEIRLQEANPDQATKFEVRNEEETIVMSEEVGEEVGEEEGGEGDTGGLQCFPTFTEAYDDLPENSWHGFFRGYQILNEEAEFNLSENKKCIEISRDICKDTLEGYIRFGVKCFCIDLFVGSIPENQELVVRLRQTEIKVSREMGYPISATVFAKLSPRLQYTGDLDTNLQADQLVLQKNDLLILTTERCSSAHCNKEVLFVNATFLMDDVKFCDVICIGPDIQVMVKENKSYFLECRVLIGGALKSRMPVLFPPKCDKYHISVEELEDITFCKELGINIIISHIIGNLEYLNDLKKSLQLFKCDRMRIWGGTRLNEMKGCENDYDWAAEAYDGFLFSLMPTPKEDQSEALKLCPASVKFMEQAYHLQKPIVFDAIRLALRKYVVDPEHYSHVYYYPDKYLFKCNDLQSSLNFLLLQEAIYTPILKRTLSKLPYCDDSLTGSDSLARSAVAASFEMHAKAIIVLGQTGRMATKLAHFRPQVPIIFVTPMLSAARFIHAYHNVIMLYYIHKPKNMPHWNVVYKHLLYGFSYVTQRKMIQHTDNVVFIYGKDRGTKYPDRYVAYKFDEKHYSTHLKRIIKPKLSTYGAVVPISPLKFSY